LKQVFDSLGVVKIQAIGHRVVHGGSKFIAATIATAESIAGVEKISHLAPLHNVANILGVKICMKILPDLPNVMVFDTAFHSTIPQSAFLYGLPMDDYKKSGIRRYGFHGTSHNFVTRKCAEMMGIPREKLRIVSCHLGNGCSVAAVKHGQSVETSMGLTPLEGLMMGTRSGDIDPAALEYIAKSKGFDLIQTINYLNNQCGLLGMAGVNSSDMRDVETAINNGHADAIAAFDVYCHRIVKYIGAYAAVMGGCDAIVFTGGVGANMSMLHDKVMSNLAFLNAKHFAIQTDEELEIAIETVNLLNTLAI